MLAHALEFAPDHDAELFSAVPAAAAVFLLKAGDPHSEPYVSKSANLRRRLMRLLGPMEEGSKRLNLRQRVNRIEYTLTGSDFESRFLMYQLLRAAFPKTYAHRLRLRFAPLVKLHLENKYPRASVTTRLGRLNGNALYYGPFFSRVMAEKFMNESLDFFKMRRCVEELHPDPAFPGCIYSEMKMCLAPCFKGCSDDEYQAEVARVQNYLESAGQSFQRELSIERDLASSNLEFENAAAIHARLAKVASVVSQLPEIVHRIDKFAAIMVQPSAQPQSVTLFRIDAGHISAPVTFSLSVSEHARSHSMEARIQQSLEAMPRENAKSALEVMEHLAMLKRWYFRSNRMGEIFFADQAGELPMRRIVRGISRVYRGESPETSASPEIKSPN